MSVHWCWGVIGKGTVQGSDSGAARANPARVAPGVLNVFPEKVTFKPGAEGGVGIH